MANEQTLTKNESQLSFGAQTTFQKRFLNHCKIDEHTVLDSLQVSYGFP